MNEPEKIIEHIKNEALEKIELASDYDSIKELNIRFLGRKGEVTKFLRSIPDLPADKRAGAGKKANQIKKVLENAFKTALEKFEESCAFKKIDVSLPGRTPVKGHIHPLTQINSEICGIFESLGFDIAEGPEIETDYYNFEALNIPKYHPARDMQDTFYISDDIVLRTHTSPVQIRAMEKQKPPVKVIAQGRVYRCDSDITHTPMFHQVEGLMVDEGVSFGDLKGVLTVFVHKMFGKDTGIRFRPSFFPFTEPSAEVDIQCVMCKGKGCRVCSNTGWLEILGSGMVHPALFDNVGYDTEKYTGFAFGMGVERIAMLKFGIDDIRRFFENDLRFLRQF